jgi:hypothetical protein
MAVHKLIPLTAGDVADGIAAKNYAKLISLGNMTPAQIQTWVTANVTNLTQAQDAIKTLAVGMSVLIRQYFKGIKV